ncbi:unnamed protein product, partial [Ectocarpus fasciculatus]
MAPTCSRGAWAPVMYKVPGAVVLPEPLNHAQIACLSGPDPGFAVQRASFSNCRRKDAEESASCGVCACSLIPRAAVCPKPLHSVVAPDYGSTGARIFVPRACIRVHDP